MNAAEFNALYEVGVPVFAYPGARREDIPSATRLVTRTRSKAQPAGLDREGVVWVDGHGAYIALTHVDVVPEDEWEAAREAEPIAAAPTEPSVEDTTLRAVFIKALGEAARTHPCPISGPYWTGCVHYDDAGRVSGVGSCHSERRADAVLAVRDVELERLRARIADLEGLLAESMGQVAAADAALNAVETAPFSLGAVARCRCGEDLDDENVSDFCSEQCASAVETS